MAERKTEPVVVVESRAGNRMRARKSVADRLVRQHGVKIVEDGAVPAEKPKVAPARRRPAGTKPAAAAPKTEGGTK